MSKNVIILGAGYGGLAAAKKLNKLLKKNPNTTITLIDNNPYHTLLTEIHEVAGNRINSEGVKIGLNDIFNSTEVNVVKDKINNIDFESKILSSKNYQYNYDYLILATGSQPTHCGIKGADENTFTLWSIDNAEEINQHIKECLQKARVIRDSQFRRELLTFAVCGGGFTGVEMLGELIEWVNELSIQYEISRDEINLYLCEGLDRILPSLDQKLTDKAMDYLKKKGVNLKIGSFVNEVKENCLIFKNGDVLNCQTIVWNCGIMASDTVTTLELKTDKKGRIEVNKYLQTTNYPEVYAIGDNAHTPWQDEKVLPALVEAALQTGETAAHNIAADINGSKKEEIKAKLHGIMVSIGGKYAVAELMGISLTSWPAMYMKHFVNMHYLFSVGGFKNGIDYILNYIKEQGSGKGIVAQSFEHFTWEASSFLLAFLRIFLGFQWLISGLDKVHNGWLAAGNKLVAGASTSPIGPNALDWYVSFMEAVIFPNAYLFQVMITMGELALASSLILGVLVPLGGIGSFFMTINFFLSGFYPQNITLPWFLFSSIAVIGAGRSLSVDYYLLPWLKRIIWRKKRGKNKDLQLVMEVINND